MIPTKAPDGAAPFTWPLGHAAAHEAATEVAVFRRDLAARFIGSADHPDMLRRLDEFIAEFRERLPVTREAGPT